MIVNRKDLLRKLDLLIFKIYKIDDDELTLIKYTREVLIPIVNRDKTIFQHVDNNLIQNYTDRFLKKLNKVYQVSIYKHSEFVIINFVNSFKEKNSVEIKTLKNKSEISFFIKDLSIVELTKTLYIQKDIKGVNRNSFFIIKPNERKCWHLATAISDFEDFNFDSKKNNLSLFNYEVEV